MDRAASQSNSDWWKPQPTHQHDQLSSLLQTTNIQLSMLGLPQITELLNPTPEQADNTITLLNEMLARINSERQGKMELGSRVRAADKEKQSLESRLDRLGEERRRLKQDKDILKAKADNAQRSHEKHINELKAQYQQELRKNSDLEFRLKLMFSTLQKKDQDILSLRNQVQKLTSSRVSQFKNSYNTTPVFAEGTFSPDVSTFPNLAQISSTRNNFIQEENTNLRAALELVYNQLRKLMKFKTQCLLKSSQALNKSTDTVNCTISKDPVLAEEFRLDLLNMPLFGGRKTVLELDTSLQNFKRLLLNKDENTVLQDKDNLKGDAQKIDNFREVQKLVGLVVDVVAQQNAALHVEKEIDNSDNGFSQAMNKLASFELALSQTRPKKFQAI